MTTIPLPVRRDVLSRADGHCERCGVFAPLELHHRLFRSRGGQHTVDNLVALCGWGNHTGCHGWAHGENVKAEAHGFSIRTGGDPALIPVFTDGGIWQRLQPNGDALFVMPPDAIEYMQLIGAMKIGAEH